MPAVELKGLEQLMATFAQLPKDLEATIIRQIARKASAPIVRASRQYVPKKTGKTAKTIGVLKVKNRQQPYVEVGFKGKSLGPIFLVGTSQRRTKKGKSTGKITKIQNPFERGAQSAGSATKKEMSVDIGRVIAKRLRRAGYTVR